MRAIWKGAISFGMVTIPVKLYTATESKDVRLRMLCKKHEAPIQEKRVCTDGGEELAWDDLVRGFEVSKNEFVVLEPEELEAAKPEQLLAHDARSAGRSRSARSLRSSACPIPTPGRRKRNARAAGRSAAQETLAKKRHRAAIC